MNDIKLQGLDAEGNEKGFSLNDFIICTVLNDGIEASSKLSKTCELLPIA